MSAGDLLLFHRPITPAAFRRDPFGTLMCALIHLTTRSRWNHTALDIGDGMMVEATSKGVTVGPIRSDDEITVIHSAQTTARDWACDAGDPADLFYGGNDLEETLAAATSCVGWRYGYFNAFWCGLRSVIPGAAHIKTGKTIICSELVSFALMYAGHRWDKDTALVSPGDVAEHFGVPR